MAVALAAASTTIVVLAYLNNQQYDPYCGYCAALGVNKVTFGSDAGQVIFVLSNVWSQDMTVVKVAVAGPNNYSAAVSTNTIIHPASNTTLSVTFPNIMFETRRNYTFTFVTSQGISLSVRVTR